MKINLKSKAIRIFLFIVILLTVLTYLIIWKHNFNIVGNNKEITIEISKNDNIDSVISTLSEAVRITAAKCVLKIKSQLAICIFSEENM